MNKKLGGISIMVLMVGVIMSLMLGGIVVYGTTQYSYTLRGSAGKDALMLAEAGVHYYRWHLGHDATDLTDGTGLPGPYVHDYKDPQGASLGTFSLTIIPPDPGSKVATIYSTGTSNKMAVRRTVKALFGQPSFAQYSFLNNATSWFGAGLTVYGRVLSNGGIRQDGINTSTIQSAKETYTCGSETGCSPSQVKPGVWGAGGPAELWEFPVAPIDFAGIGIDFNQMKAAAQAEGVYLGPSGAQGYRFEFIADGTVKVYRVNNTGWRNGYSNEAGCVRLYQRVTNDALIGTYQLSSKHIFLAEDTVWAEGVVDGEATVVAAKFPLAANPTNIWIRNSITYKDKNGSDSLGLVASNDIYFVLDLPQIFEVDAALLAQSGRVFRHFYGSGCGNYGSAVRDQLIIYGAVISNNKSAWNWGSGPSSGFITRTVTYDGHLFLMPPPYFPTQGIYDFISWEEVDNP